MTGLAELELLAWLAGLVWLETLFWLVCSPVSIVSSVGFVSAFLRVRVVRLGFVASSVEAVSVLISFFFITMCVVNV